MHWIDIIAIITALFFIYKSYHEGLLTSLFRLAGLVLGIIIAANMGHLSSSFFQEQFNWAVNVADIVGYIAIFILIILLAQVLGYFLRTLINAVHLGWIDQLGGILLGVLKAAIVISLLLWLIFAIPAQDLQDDIKQNSTSYRILGNFAPSLYESLVQPYLNESNLKNQFDTILTDPSIDSLSSISKFQEEIGAVEGVDQNLMDEMTQRFKQLPISKQIQIANKISAGNVDLQEIVNILYSETP